MQFPRRSTIVAEILDSILSGKGMGLIQRCHIKQGTELFPAVDTLLKYRQPFRFGSLIIHFIRRKLPCCSFLGCICPVGCPRRIRPGLCTAIRICNIRCIRSTTRVTAQAHHQHRYHCCRADHDPERRLAIIQYMTDPVLHMIFTKRKQGTDGTAPIPLPFSTGSFFQQCIGIDLLALLAEKLHNFFIAGHLTIHVHQIKCQPYQRVKPMHTADQQSCRFEKVIPALQMHSLVAQHDFSALRIQSRREIDHRMHQSHDKGQMPSIDLADPRLYLSDTAVSSVNPVPHTQVGKGMIPHKSCHSK